MNIFESINESSTDAIEAGENYAKRTEEYLKLKIFQQIAFSSSMLVKMAVFGGFVFLGFIFLAISAAIALGEFLNSVALGILFVGLIMFLFSLVIFLLRKKIDRTIIRKYSKLFFD